MESRRTRKKTHRQRCFGVLTVCLFVLSASCTWASEVVLVASSFPKALLSTYKKAFDAQSPDYRVEFVNFPATNAVAYLRDRVPGSRIDVFWAS